jgi:hypothetical protein
MELWTLKGNEGKRGVSKDAGRAVVVLTQAPCSQEELWFQCSLSLWRLEGACKESQEMQWYGREGPAGDMWPVPSSDVHCDHTYALGWVRTSKALHSPCWLGRVGTHRHKNISSSSTGEFNREQSPHEHVVQVFFFFFFLLFVCSPGV